MLTAAGSLRGSPPLLCVGVGVGGWVGVDACGCCQALYDASATVSMIRWGTQFPGWLSPRRRLAVGGMRDGSGFVGFAWLTVKIKIKVKGATATAAQGTRVG